VKRKAFLKSAPTIDSLLATGISALHEGACVPHFLSHYDHVPLHRLWTFATLQDELSRSEHAHILECEDCRLALRATLNAENFGAVLRELKRGESTEFEDPML
jgi:hypothetical protein